MINFKLTLENDNRVYSITFRIPPTFVQFCQVVCDKFNLNLEFYNIYLRTKNEQKIEIKSFKNLEFLKNTDIELYVARRKKMRIFPVFSEVKKQPSEGEERKIKLIYRSNEFEEEDEIKIIERLVNFDSLHGFIKKNFLSNEREEYEIFYANKNGGSTEIQNENDLIKCYEEITPVSNYVRLIVFSKNLDMKEDTTVTSFPVWKRYLVQTKGDCLGEGSGGKVYLGIDRISGELVAVKSQQMNEETMEKVETEMEILKKLNHTNIVKYLACTREKKYLNMFMEHAPGGSLFNLIKGNFPFDECVIRKYVKDILNGIHYLHRNKIVHADIKAQNIVLGKGGIAKLADFGCARIIQMFGVKQKMIRGTVNFIAPESILYGICDFPVDIWSLGCLVIQLCGHSPWSELIKKDELIRGGERNALFKIKSEFKNGKTPKIPEKLSKIGQHFVQRCLQIDVLRRATIYELLKHPFITKRFDLNIYPVDSYVRDDEDYLTYSESFETGISYDTYSVFPKESKKEKKELKESSIRDNYYYKSFKRKKIVEKKKVTTSPLIWARTYPGKSPRNASSCFPNHRNSPHHQRGGNKRKNQKKNKKSKKNKKKKQRRFM